MWTLKQVEFNSYSIAGGTHANNAANMHQFVATLFAAADPPTD
jgi:hypothetical protein